MMMMMMPQVSVSSSPGGFILDTYLGVGLMFYKLGVCLSKERRELRDRFDDPLQMMSILFQGPGLDLYFSYIMQLVSLFLLFFSLLIKKKER